MKRQGQHNLRLGPANTDQHQPPLAPALVHGKLVHDAALRTKALRVIIMIMMIMMLIMMLIMMN